MRIIHCADIHLGRRRLNGHLPEADLARAFEQIVRRTLEWKADLLLIAGDLFDQPQLAPATLRQAEELLAPLQKAAIPVLAIEGNRDRAPRGEELSWLGYLARRGLLVLLGNPFTAQGADLSASSPRPGPAPCWIHRGLRFVGAGYLGSSLERRLGELLEALPADPLPNLLLLHAECGEGAPGRPGLPPGTLARLKERFVYIALGHRQRPYTLLDEAGRPWAVHPGAPENEVPARGEGPRGWAEVEIDPAALPGMKLSSARIVDCPRRPLVCLDLEVTAIGNKLKGAGERLEAEAAEHIRAAGCPPEALVCLSLTGRWNIGRNALEPRLWARRVAGAAGIAGLQFDLAPLQLYTGRAQEAAGGQGASGSWGEVEARVLAEQLAARPPEDLEGETEAVRQLYLELLRACGRGVPAEELLNLLNASPLPEHLARRAQEL